jgi:hypothetical protein
METLSVIALLLALFAGVAYALMAPPPESRFARDFSPEDVARKARSGLNLSLSPFDAVGEGVGTGFRTKWYTPVWLEIEKCGDDHFDESAVMRAFHNEIEKAIRESGANVTGEEFSLANRFTIAYQSRRLGQRILGRVRVSGRREGDQYELSLDLEERRWGRRA